MSQRERLCHTDKCVVDGTISVWMEARHCVTGDTSTFHKGTVGTEALLLHVPDDPAVDRLETVAHVREGARHDDRHRVVEEGVLHLLLQRDRTDRVARFGCVRVNRGDWCVAHDLVSSQKSRLRTSRALVVMNSRR